MHPSEQASRPGHGEDGECLRIISCVPQASTPDPTGKGTPEALQVYHQQGRELCSSRRSLLFAEEKEKAGA